MDNAELASNSSYNSDSLQSSLSGLSLYQDEYTELLHLVNPSKHPEPHSGTPLVPRVVQKSEGDVNDQIQHSLGLTTSQRVQELVKRNQELETELIKANKQINRLVNCHNSLQVEKEVQGLWTTNTKLREWNTKLQREKHDLEMECKGLKISLAELETKSQVNKGLVASLKEKVSQHYVEWQQELKQSANLKLVVSDLTVQLKEADRLKFWYKTQFNQWQNTKSELQSCQIQVEHLKADNSKLQLKLTECKSELDNAQLEALKEKSQLWQKLEKFNLEFIPIEPIISLTPCQNCCQNTSEEMLTQLKTQLSIKNLDVTRLIDENSTITSKCIVLQKMLQHKESEIEGLDLRRKESNLRLQQVQESEQTKEKQIQQLKAQIAALQVELNGQKADKASVERQIEMLRSQFAQFKENYDLGFPNQVKDNLHQKTDTMDKSERDSTKDQSETNSLERATDDQKVELKQQNYTKTVLKSIEEYVTNFFDNLNTEEFESHVDIRLKYLEERFRALKGKFGRLEVVALRNDPKRRVKELEVLLQVRDRELKEKQLRMDRNNRTLLRKVKEHMKGRNYAEKQLETLRNMYDNLAEEHHSLKLTLTRSEAVFTDLRLKCNSQEELIQNLCNQLVEKELLEENETNLRLELGEALKQVTLNSSDLQQTIERLEESKVRQRYEHSLKEYQSRVSGLESEKYFFQRLCKDLKSSYTLCNKVNNHSFNIQYDEESVRQLLAESKQACDKKLASWEIKHGLDQLRDEICNLQVQIVMKSGCS